jgi:hypothetical protein
MKQNNGATTQVPLSGVLKESGYSDQSSPFAKPWLPHDRAMRTRLHITSGMGKPNTGWMFCNHCAGTIPGSEGCSRKMTQSLCMLYHFFATASRLGVAVSYGVVPGHYAMAMTSQHMASEDMLPTPKHIKTGEMLRLVIAGSSTEIRNGTWNTSKAWH